MKTPLKAIRKKCVDCCANQRKEVKLCPHKTCPLWHYRFGKKPKVFEEVFFEFKPRKKGAVWAIRNEKRTRTVYVFKKNQSYVVGRKQFSDLELAKDYAREKIGA